MKKLVADAGLSDQFQIDSAATSTEEIGNPVYPPARRKLAEHGISCAGKTARQLTQRDYQYYDHLIAMDQNNIRNMMRMLGGDPDHKIDLLLNFTDNPREVADPQKVKTEIVPRDIADPWYTGNFDATWRDCLAGCTALLRFLMGKN